MNAIADAVASLSQSFATNRSLAEHARARSAHPALAPYDKPTDVLAALAESSPLSQDERSAVVLALVTEHQRSRHPLWQSLLLAAFEPMLHGVAKRTLGVSREDARQGALAGFLDAIAKVRVEPAPAILTRALRYATERAAFGQVCLSEEPQAEPVGPKEPDPRDVRAKIAHDDQLRAVLRELVALFGDEAQAREVFDVLLYARRNSGPLLAYVDETYATLTRAKRDKIFSRLSVMRARALRHLAEVFGGTLDIEVEVSVA